MIDNESILNNGLFILTFDEKEILGMTSYSNQSEVLDTGFKELDDITGGLKSGELIEVVGESELCSMFTNNFIINGNQDRVATVIFSHSRNDKSVGLEMLSSVGRIDKNLLDTGNLRKVNDLDYFNASNKINRSNLRVSADCPSSLEEMYEEIYFLREELGVRIFIIDNYTSIFSGQYDESSDKGQSDIYNGLKALAKDLNIIVVILTEESYKTVDFSEPDGPRIVDRISDLQINIAVSGDNNVVKFTVYDQDKELVEFTRKWVPKYCCFDPITTIDEQK